MSYFSEGQMAQLAASLEAADWTPNDVTLLGQAGRDRLVGVRDSLRRGGDIISAINEGRTELWLAPGQDTGWVRGRAILAHLTETGLLAGCADLAELEAVRAKGLPFFRKYFAGKMVFGWRGVRGDSVPFLCGSDDRVVLGWHWLDFSWGARSPALRRK